MIRNYFNIAWRNLKKNRLYSFVNLIGLTIGITSCILIGLYIAHEWSYDRFQKNGDHIVRATMEFQQGGKIEGYAQTGTKVGPQLKRLFPAIDGFVRTFKYGRVVARSDKMFDEKNFLYADSSFFRIFSFPLVKGNPSTVLNAPQQIVLTEAAAIKYFGNEDPIGKTLKIGNNKDFTVTGIAKESPGNSQIRFDFVASFTSLDASKTEEWWTANYVTYFILTPDADLPQLQQQIKSYMQTAEMRKAMDVEGSDWVTYDLEPLKKVHLSSNKEGLEPNGNITYIYILAAIAILILIIACVNYTNLATAQSAGRTGEISIRKVLGAGSRQLFGQYLGESALLVFVSLVLAMILSSALLPVFNQLSGKDLSASILLRPLPLLYLGLLGIFVSLMAGAYPAFVLSNIKLPSLLKSGFRFSSSGNGIRKSLIIFQFVISVFLIVSTIVIIQQLQFIQHKNLGFDKEHVLVLPVDYQMRTRLEDFKKVIAANPGVVSVGAACGNPTFVQWGDGIKANKGGELQKLSVNCIPADVDFIPTLGMDIIAGANFTNADFSRFDNNHQFNYTFILNESAVKALGWTPQQAIGKTIEKNMPGIVKGVVKDFHFTSLHEPIRPLMLFLDSSFTNNLYIKISGNSIAAVMGQVQKIWKERVPYRPFEYHFLDEDYNALYKVETRTGQLFTAFSITAILLACLGLFALSAFTTVQRTKEIGIRKVLGASLFSVVGLISKDFLRLVGIATLIAFPLAWLAMNKWLQDFAYRIPVSSWVFVIAGLLAIAIALFSVSFQAIKAGLANPVESLKEN